MRPRALAILGAVSLLIVVACTASSRQMWGDQDTTDDFSFDVVQRVEVQVMDNASPGVDVPFDITIGNRTKETWRVDRISLQTFERGSYEIPLRSRTFQKQIAAGDTEKFEFWANANVTDPQIGTKKPVTIRTIVDFTSPQAKREEVFVRAINGSVVGGIQSSH